MAAPRTIKDALKKLRNRQREIALMKLADGRPVPEDPYYSKLITDFQALAKRCLLGELTELSSPQLQEKDDDEGLAQESA